MNQSLTRRGLLALAAATPAAAQAQPGARAVPSTPAEETAATQADFKSRYEQLARVKLPMSTEPAARFKA